MELHLKDDHNILLEDDEYLAVRQSGNIELWSKEGDERYGVLPENYTLVDIQRVMSFFVVVLHKVKSMVRSLNLMRSEAR